jgi:hypothetical protein
VNSNSFLIAAVAAFGLTGAAMAQTPYAAAAPAQTQTPAPAQAPAAAPARPQGQPWTEAPILTGAAAAPDCGNLHNLAGRAFCVTAPLGQMETLAEAYITSLQGLGWIVADGDANRVVFIKRTGAGACDGVQMIAFYDTAKPAVPESPAWLGFATIPGNICASRPAAAPAAAQ